MSSAADELEAAEEEGKWQSSLGGFLHIKMGMGLFVSSREHRESRKERLKKIIIFHSLIEKIGMEL